MTRSLLRATAGQLRAEAALYRVRGALQTARDLAMQAAMIEVRLAEAA